MYVSPRSQYLQKYVQDIPFSLSLFHRRLWKLSAFINRGTVYSFSRVPGAQYHRHLLHHSPEGWKSEIKVWAELVSSEASFPGLWMASSLCIFRLLLSVHVSVISSFYKDISHRELGHMLMTSF